MATWKPRTWLLLLLAACLLAAGALWWPGAAQTSGPSMSAEASGAPSDQTSSRGSAPPAADNRSGRALATDEPVRGQVEALRPPEVPATDADGHVEVRVSSGGRPLAHARVRLYLRGDPDKSTQRVEFRLAGAGESDTAGRLRLPAKAGVYLVAARFGTLAPALRELLRRSGERVSQVALELHPGVQLEGRTSSRGEPVPLALVTLTPGAGRDPRLPADAPAEEEVRATSDERGLFRFTGLAPGRYGAVASATGYARSNARSVDVPGAAPLVIELAAASFIEGQVVDAQGRPAGGAEVTAVGAQDAVSATATGTGSFSMEVEPGSYRLGAHRGDEAGAVDAALSVASGATARGVRITLAAASGIAGTVVARGSAQGQQPAPAQVAPAPGAPRSAPSQGAQESGPAPAAAGSPSAQRGQLPASGSSRSPLAAGAPIAGARVAVSPHGSNGDSGRAVTGPDGSFAVSGLAPGSYDVDIVADGYGDEIRQGVTVSAGQRFPLRVEMSATGAVEGTVRDAAGRSVGGAVVSANARFGMSAGPSIPEARADESGNFRLGGLRAGELQLSARREGAASGTALNVLVPEGGTARADFTLTDEGAIAGHVRRKSGQPAPPTAVVRAFPAHASRVTGADMASIPVDANGAFSALLPEGPWNFVATLPGGAGSTARAILTLEAGRTLNHDFVLPDESDPGVGFSGIVLEPDGTPSPRAFVFVQATATERRFAWGSFADDAGRFHVDRPRSDLPDSFEVLAVNGGRAGRVAVAAGQGEAKVQLLPAATLRGHVASGGAPVTTFTVTTTVAGTGMMFVPGGNSQTLEFAGDRFELRDLPADKLHVAVGTRDGRSGSADIALTPGGSGDLEVPLVEDAAVAGRVIDAQTGEPVPNAAISEGGHPQLSSPDGRFRLGGLAPGDHSLRFQADRYQGLSRTVTLAPGTPLDLGDVPLKRLQAKPGTIGADLRGDSEGVVVWWTLPEGPAEQAGMRAGDQVTAIDGAAVKGVTDALLRLRGAPGTAVQVTVSRNGESRPLRIVRAG